MSPFQLVLEPGRSHQRLAVRTRQARRGRTPSPCVLRSNEKLLTQAHRCADQEPSACKAVQTRLKRARAVSIARLYDSHRRRSRQDRVQAGCDRETLGFAPAMEHSRPRLCWRRDCGALYPQAGPAPSFHSGQVARSRATATAAVGLAALRAESNGMRTRSWISMAGHFGETTPRTSKYAIVPSFPAGTPSASDYH